MNDTGARLGLPSDEVIAEIDRLCDAARFSSAHALTLELAPFESWESSDALCTAARLTEHLGGSQRARRLALRAYRREPMFAEARFWVGMDWLARRGALAAWQWLGDYEPPPDTAPRYLASVLWLRTMIATSLRDFDEAERRLERADAVAPDEPFGKSIRVDWLSAQDRYEEALALAQESVERHPTHRPSLHSFAELLQLHGRFDQALEVLVTAAPEMESGSLWFEIACLQQELGRHRESLESLERAERMSPLLEDGGKRRLAALRADAAYFLGDEATALAEARKVGTPFFDRLAERLSAPANGRGRAQLDVKFVRQHHLTCVPATLSMLGRFWEKPVDQLDVADRICYDGTRSHSERLWANETGWQWRELTASWDVTRALIDRGVPFAVDTVHVISAHAQAVVGYDERRGTITIRDPFVPTKIEALAEPFFQSYAAHGPRAFALVPPERGELLRGVELPDAELFQLAEAVESALEVHDRAAAAAKAAELEARAAGHRLVLSVRRALAAYDANPFEMLRVAEAALEKFPDEPTWRITHLNALRETATSERYLRELETLCSRKETHPAFREMLAGELMRDAREHERAARILREVISQLRERAAPVALLGDCHWYAREFERAVALHRFAACLEPTNDSAAQEYFRAALVCGRPEEALGFLERRAERFRRQSAGPTIAAFIALEQIDRTPRGFELLSKALEARPDDGDLLAFAAVAHARYGELDAAEARLGAGEKCLPRHRWARVAARIATLSGDHERALTLWREVVEALPLDVDAHAALAARIATVHGESRARAHTAAASARFPENAALLGLHLQWLRTEEPKTLESALRRLMALEPTNAWARRELALTLAKLGRYEEARAECALAVEVAPYDASGQLVSARLAELEGRHDDAKRAYRAALELAADSTLAISGLIDGAGGTEECTALLASIESLVAERDTSGDGLIAWYRHARRHLEPGDLAERLERIRERRSELWAAWLCSVQHRRYSGDHEGAVSLARVAVERCPLVPGLWLELANALGGAGDVDGQRAALERAVAIAPGFAGATLALADALDRAGSDDGLAVIERGLRFEPLDTSLLVARADAFWRMRRRNDAIAALRRAIEVDSSDGGAWARLREWDRSEDFDAASAIEQIAERRPWDAGLWYRLAEIQSDTDPNRALASVERALALDPSAVDGHDLRAVIAATLGHRSLALAACRPKHFGDRVPLALRGREAWVLAHFGDLKEAVTRMRAVVAERPDYGWGWRQIADITERLGDTAAALEAARAMVRLEPNAAFVHGYLGQALADAGQTDDALEAFRRAIQLDPSYRYGVHRYLEIALKSGRIKHARRTLKRHARHLLPADVPFWKLRFAISERNWPAAEKHAHALFSDPEASPVTLEAARSALTEADPLLAKNVLFDVASQPDSPAQAGAAWARAACAWFPGPSASTLARVARANPGAGAEAIDAVLAHLGAHARTVDAFMIVLRHWRFVRSRDALWGQFGYVLINDRHYLSGVLWLWGYEHRKPEPWMLLNLVVSLRALGFESAARRVGRDALALAPDNAFPAHATLLALDAALGRGGEEAELLFGDVGAGQLAPYFERIHDLVGSLLALESSPRADRAMATDAAFHALEMVYSRGLFSILSLESIEWRRVARRIGRSSGTLAGIVRGYWDSLLAMAVVTFLIWASVASGGRALLWFAAGWVISAVLRRVRFD